MVAGSAGASASGLAPMARSLFNPFTTIKITNAMIMKFRTWAKKVPKFKEGGFSPEASAKFHSSKLIPPVIIEIRGITMSLTRELTMPVNAAPIIIPTARSMTLPREMNSLNSPINFFICVSPLSFVFLSISFWYRTGNISLEYFTLNGYHTVSKEF